MFEPAHHAAWRTHDQQYEYGSLGRDRAQSEEALAAGIVSGPLQLGRPEEARCRDGHRVEVLRRPQQEDGALGDQERRHDGGRQPPPTGDHPGNIESCLCEGGRRQRWPAAR
jgi:hypothetical protein